MVGERAGLEMGEMMGKGDFGGVGVGGAVGDFVEHGRVAKLSGG